MSDLNVLARQRRSSVRSIGRAVKAVDTAVEALQRAINRILQRKRQVPTIQDFIRMGELIREIDGELSDLFQVHNAALEVDMQSGVSPGAMERLERRN